MKKERTNSIQIYKYKLIDYMSNNINGQKQVNIILTQIKEYTNFNANIKYENKSEFDKLIEESRKELDIDDKIKKFREDKNKRNEESKIQDLIYEKNKKRILEEMKLDEEYFKKRSEKIELEFQNKLKNLENKKKMNLERERIEQDKRIEEIEKKRLEDEKKMQQDLEKKIDYIKK